MEVVVRGDRYKVSEVGLPGNVPGVGWVGIIAFTAGDLHRR